MVRKKYARRVSSSGPLLCPASQQKANAHYKAPQKVARLHADGTGLRSLHPPQSHLTEVTHARQEGATRTNGFKTPAAPVMT